LFINEKAGFNILVISSVSIIINFVIILTSQRLGLAFMLGNQPYRAWAVVDTIDKLSLKKRLDKQNDHIHRVFSNS
jgi:hypothetical protein